ncbi:MAG: hypothetical protein V1661_00720 [bacterium]
MKITEKELIDIAAKRMDEIIKLEKNLIALAPKGLQVADMGDVFAEFINAFPDEEKSAAYTLLFMLGARMGKKMRPLTLYKDDATLKKIKKPGRQKN